MKGFFTIMAAALCLWGCEKIAEPGTFEALADEMCGDYVLMGTHWTGTPIDLNGDGTGHNELIKELCWFNGYYEPNHFAEIAVSDIMNDDKTFAVSVMLPYPVFMQKDGVTAISGVEYLPLTLRETYIGGDKGIALKYGPISFEQADDVFLRGITEVMITDFKEGAFTIRLRCHMKEPDDKDFTHEYLHYHYKVRN